MDLGALDMKKSSKVKRFTTAKSKAEPNLQFMNTNKAVTEQRSLFTRKIKEIQQTLISKLGPTK